MTMEPQISLNCEGTSSSSINLVPKDVNPGLITSLQDLNTSQPPVKKQPRQWAAWTRQEEESFFMALRQVGKNFEKITSRVQSKNKDQVRHYYYRLVRRMNKLLGPELCLDARNCKVTNAAMLRWWSLLEKYSCKASKLHLKPRRYKLFIETLENQLLRDRRKNIKKQPSQGDTSSTSPSQAVKEVKIQKSGNGKGSSTKNIGINHANCKPTRLRKKKGSTVAYRKWEKAAIAGVSLVAEAAEQLERTNINKEGPLFTEHAKEDVNPLFNEDNNIQCSGKLKLQLFPIDESTRKALEMDNHNPHLELTLSTRKKISSVMEHLYRKWGNSSIANGELMLFPYNTHKENLVGSMKWSKECNINASDVFTLVGSPPIFRLRYGWFPMKEQNVSMGSNVNNVESFITQVNTLEDLRTHKGSTSTNEWADSLTNISIGDLLNEDPNCIINSNSPTILNTCSENLHQIPFTCDSFDAAIAAHINNHQIKPITCNESSIWDAEETCDGFSFHKNVPSSTSKPQEINEAHKPLNECSYVEDLNGLTDIYWPESLGGLDMDIASSKYHSEDLILNDSLGGLNRLIANSLDAFQNCSFFGLDKKESGASKLEAQETISFVDCEIGTKV